MYVLLLIFYYIKLCKTYGYCYMLDAIFPSNYFRLLVNFLGKEILSAHRYPVLGHGYPVLGGGTIKFTIKLTLQLSNGSGSPNCHQV